jgi:predicted aminopeptidase
VISDKSSSPRAAGRPYHLSLITCHAFVAAAALLLLGGCSNLGYYWQSVSGQMEIWRLERPLREVIADPATSGDLKERLLHAAEIREFASRELGLPDNGSYRSFADLGRSFVVWNVFATPEFSVQPVRWCFPVTGCVNYRGYFSREEAERYAAGLAREGHDVYVGGVAAYSTLGYFDDPVLNTFVYYAETELARLIFHELAHQIAYAPGDTTFNESFAVTVEEEGVRRWLARRGGSAKRDEFERFNRARSGFSSLVLKYRERLETLYGSGMAPEEMRSRKEAILSELEAEYRVVRAGWDGFTGYDRWFATPPNNARVASVAVYTRMVPAFQALLEREGGDLPRFYAEVKRLAALSKEEREAHLKAASGS